MADWIRVEDKLPDECQRVDVYGYIHIQKVNPAERLTDVMFNTAASGTHWFGGWSVEGGYITHWMPLPRPPK